MADPRSTMTPLSLPHLEMFYGSSQLVPVPLIAHSINVERDENGDRQNIITTRTLTGEILTSGMGYEFVRAKQTELQNTFSQDNLEFKIQASAYHPRLPSGTLIEANVFPKVVSLDIREDIQVMRLSYVVVLETETFTASNSGIQNLSNTWQYTENENECSVDITHSVSAQGVNTSISGLPSNALTNAVDKVRSLLGLAHAPSGFPYYVQPGSGVDNTFWELTTSRDESISIEDATYAVTESFKLVSGLLPYIDERTSQFQLDAENVATVTLQGTVRGLGRTNDGGRNIIGQQRDGTGFLNALSGFNNNLRPVWGSDANIVYSRFGGSGTLAVNNPQSISIGQNICNGTITYSVTYTDDPSENLPSGIEEMSFTVQRNDPVVRNAIIAVPFNALGPVFQRLCSTSEGTYTIQGTVRATSISDEVVETNRAIEVAETEVIRLQPNPPDFIKLRLTGRNQTVDRINRSVTVSITYTFSQSISTVPGDESPIALWRVS